MRSRRDRGDAGGPSGRVARRVVVSGHVQGVFFRATVAEAARHHGVAGWAANCTDGSVEVFLEGDPASVEHVLEVCRTGPRAAHVDRVEVIEDAPTGASGFATR